MTSRWYWTASSNPLLSAIHFAFGEMNSAVCMCIWILHLNLRSRFAPPLVLRPFHITDKPWEHTRYGFKRTCWSVATHFTHSLLRVPPDGGNHLRLRRSWKPRIFISTYTTPFHLYSALRRTPSALFVVDDCNGILSDSLALSVLKSATWPVSGPESKRI